MTPGTFTFTPVDTNGNGKYDKLVANVAVTVTDAGTFRAGNYRIEGLLVDEYGTEIAWSVSNPQALVVGTNTMTLEFDGKMLYDQLPLAGRKSLEAGGGQDLHRQLELIYAGEPGAGGCHHAGLHPQPVRAFQPGGQPVPG